MFTVEIKRRRSKSPHPFTAPQGHPRESLRRRGSLMSEGHGLSAQPSANWGDSNKISHPQETAPFSTATPGVELSAKFRTGRILPDVLSAQRNAEWNQQKAAEGAVVGRMKRSKASLGARQRQFKAATRQPSKHVSSSEPTLRSLRSLRFSHLRCASSCDPMFFPLRETEIG